MNLFKIGDEVITKSNGVRKIVAINIFVTESKTRVQYLLSGFDSIFFYEEDLKLAKEK